MNDAEALTRQILQLPPDQRLAVAARVLESLGDLTPMEEEEVERLWGVEAYARLELDKNDPSAWVDSEAAHTAVRRALER